MTDEDYASAVQQISDAARNARAAALASFGDPQSEELEDQFDEIEGLGTTARRCEDVALAALAGVLDETDATTAFGAISEAEAAPWLYEVILQRAIGSLPAEDSD